MNEYVQNTLIPDVQGMGNEYAADSYWGSNLWGYYWSRCGQYMDQWLNQFPGGLCIVVKAHDFESELFGQWINSYLSIDYKDGAGGNHILEDCQLHYFYVDKAPYTMNEHTSENWPRGANCNSPLPTDGLKNGEYSVWIIRPNIDCSIWLNWQSCRLRIKDDCQNWTRSENLTPGINRDVIISNPNNNSPVIDGEPVTFTAQISGNPNNQGLAELIKWSARIEENGEWVEYGPHEPPPFNDWEDKIYSAIPQNEDWTGSTFSIDEFRDCELTMRARLEICNTTYDDFCRVFWIAGERGGQSLCGSDEIALQIEPGIIRSNDPDDPLFIHLSQQAPIGQDEVQIYWIDGPSIPFFANNNEGDWHDTSLETIDVEPDLEDDYYPNPAVNVQFYPVWDDLEVGQIKIRICVPMDAPYSFYELYIKNEAGNVVWSEIVNLNEEYFQNCAECPNQTSGYVYRGTHEWIISDDRCGYYQVIVEGRDSTQMRGVSYYAQRQHEIYLDVVKPYDITLISSIYFYDGYLWGGSRPPHHERQDTTCTARMNGTVDCTNYLTQLLRRLGRTGTFNGYIQRQGASDYRDDTRFETIPHNELGTLAAGDIIVWLTGDGHVGIFLGWDMSYYVADCFPITTYHALVLESFGDCADDDQDGDLGHVGIYPRELISGIHRGRRFRIANNMIFHPCTQ